MNFGGYHLGSATKLLTVVLSIAVVLNFWLLYRIDNRLNRLEVQNRAQTAAAVVYGPNQFDAIPKLCPRSTNVSPVCKALADHSFENLGSHDDLWVALDAILQVSSAKLDPNQRRQMDRLLVDLSSAISANGAWNHSQRTDEDSDYLVASDLYWPIVAQAVACDSVADLGCAGKLPADVSAALNKVAAFILRIGPEVAPYEMSFRIGAVRNLVNTEL